MKRGVGSCCRVRQICKNGVKNRRVHELMMSKKLEPGKENRAPLLLNQPSAIPMYVSPFSMAALRSVDASSRSYIVA